MLCDVLISVLRSARADLNAQFAQAKREHPALDDAAFTGFIEQQIDPLARLAPGDQAYDVISTAWECGLELVAQRLAGPQARHPWINETWSLLAAQLAHSPRQLIPAFSNAAHHLATTPGARPRQWLELMQNIAQVVSDAPTLLHAGQIAAWRAGLAHYREGALKLIAALEPKIAQIALGAESAAFLEKVIASPWIEKPAGNRENLRAGSFRGFGGLFIVPPLVTAVNDQLFVRSGDDVWLLTADSFGATFHRGTLAEFQAGSGSRFDDAPADIGVVTSVARTRHTVAVTGSLTHAVLLFAA